MSARSRRFVWSVALALMAVMAGCSALGPEPGAAEVRVRKGLSSDQAWDQLVGAMSRLFYLERAEKNAFKDSGVIYTGWTSRVAGKQLPNKKFRVMVVHERQERKVKVMVEETDPAGDAVPADKAFVQLVKGTVQMAVGIAPTRST
jgi:hypothetical protein